MKTLPATLFTLLAALICTGPLQAHHASKFFNINEPVWVQGTVASFIAVNPHAKMVLDVQDENGHVVQWTVEGPRFARMQRQDIGPDFLRPGDSVEVCGFFPSEAMLALNRPAGSDVRKDTYIHGRLLVKADGQRWLWGPYGNLETCIDPAQWDTIIHGRNPLPDQPR